MNKSWWAGQPIGKRLGQMMWRGEHQQRRRRCRRRLSVLFLASSTSGSSLPLFVVKAQPSYRLLGARESHGGYQTEIHSATERDSVAVVGKQRHDLLCLCCCCCCSRWWHSRQAHPPAVLRTITHSPDTSSRCGHGNRCFSKQKPCCTTGKLKGPLRLRSQIERRGGGAGWGGGNRLAVDSLQRRPLYTYSGCQRAVEKCSDVRRSSDNREGQCGCCCRRLPAIPAPAAAVIVPARTRAAFVSAHRRHDA